MFTFFPSPLRSTLACPSGLVKWKDFGDKTGGTLLWNSGIPLEAKWENAESGTKMLSRASSLSQVTLRISLELAQRNLRWGAWIHLKYCLAAFTQPWSGVWNSRAESPLQLTVCSSVLDLSLWKHSPTESFWGILQELMSWKIKEEKYVFVTPVQKNRESKIPRKSSYFS